MTMILLPKPFFVKQRSQPMEEHHPKKLWDQVRVCPELSEGMPSPSNTTRIAASRPTSAGAKSIPPEANATFTVRDPDSADTEALLNVVRDGYWPFQVVALGAPDRDTAVPLLQDRGLVDGQAAAYVCDAPVPGHPLACQAPVTAPQALEELIGVL
jgi:hypothetical protein